MQELANKQVLVAGLGLGGRAACELLCRHGAKVVVIDGRNTPELRAWADLLGALGVDVRLGISAVPQQEFDLAVLSSGCVLDPVVLQALRHRELPLISELELGFEAVNCLTIAVSGVNGKSTTVRLLERMLRGNDRKTLVCDDTETPVCSVAEQSREADFLVVQADFPQLELAKTFRPAVAVLLNLPPEPPNGAAHRADPALAAGHLFENQQAFDWAVIQSEALARLRALDLPIPAKIISFSAADPAADLRLERGLLLSHVGNWSGPLLNMDHCQLRGPHNAENLMAALAVGHAVRLPLEDMIVPLKTCPPAPHRFQLVAEVNGVEFVNDSKSVNLQALHQALLAARPAPGGEPNVWLIAGGRDNGLEFHDLGPTLSRRVKGAFLIGEAAEKIRSAWSLFTPCIHSASLLEAVTEAAGSATSGDVVLLSPACSGVDQFRDDEERGQFFCQAVKSICRGPLQRTHNISDK